MSDTDILVVDDDPNIRELLSVNLQAAGRTVATAVDGIDGTAKIRSLKPRLVILDVMMPDRDGWDFCKIVRDDPALRSVKILMLTARDRERDRMIGIDILGADEYMTKPFDLAELLETVRRLLA